MVGLVLVPKREGEGERGSMNSSRKFFAYARMDETEGKSKRERERKWNFVIKRDRLFGSRVFSFPSTPPSRLNLSRTGEWIAAISPVARNRKQNRSAPHGSQ